MTAWPANPVIYEVNTAVWLNSLSRAAGRRLTLADVTSSDWEAVTPAGADAVWLMGVWERSPAGLAVTRADSKQMASFQDVLPDLKPEDIIGSPYCVRRYVADEMFGGPDGLAVARAALAARGVRLLLDYVPNHVAMDHPWVTSTPEVFMHGGEHDITTDPEAWATVGGQVLAHGRDPYFPPWTDVVQLNAFAPALRAAAAETLIDVAGQCDGLRCDMAMLMINRIFRQTWGDRAGPEPAEEFWPALIAEVRSRHPDTLFVAEAYWDLEWELQQQGFDFCYDKRLYDRIVALDAAGIRGHLGADPGYQSRLIRFLENHDEPRISASIPAEAVHAAAVAIGTLPGATLWQEGQFEGRHVRPPVFLTRRPDEQPDHDLADWYRRLVAIVGRGVRSGTWQLLEATGWPDNQSCRNLLAWSWDGDRGGHRHVVVINFSGQPAQGRVRLPWADLPGRTWPLTALLAGDVFERDGDELASTGLYVSLGAWEFHLLSLP